MIMEENEIPASVGEEWLTYVPWRDRAVSLVCVGSAHAPHQEHTLAGKRAMFEEESECSSVLVAWTGKYRTEVRFLGWGERDEVAVELG